MYFFVFIYLLVSTMTPSSDKLDCLCGRFGDQEMLLGTNFNGKSMLLDKIEAIWTSSFKTKAKMENVCHCVSLTSLLKSRVSQRFSSAFYGQKLTFFRESNLEFTLHRDKSTITWLFSRRWLKNWFQANLCGRHCLHFCSFACE